jgi:replicative DNA helicase
MGNNRKITNITRDMLPEHCRVQPQAIDLEEAVLGGIMLDKEGIHAVVGLLRPEVFYKDAHQTIYKSIQELYNRSEAIDVLTVASDLRANGELENVGGPYFLSQLTNRVASSAHIEDHARLIYQKFIAREMISVSSEILAMAYMDDTDVFDVLAIAEGRLQGISAESFTENVQHISEIAIDAAKRADEIVEKAKNGSVVGVPSGFVDLDKCTGGWQNSDFVIIAGRPSMGKTSVALEMAKRSAKAGKPALFFSLEMSKIQLATKYGLGECDVEPYKLKTGKLSDQELIDYKNGLGRVGSLPLYVNDESNISIRKLRSTIRKQIRENDIKIVFIDYLQLMSSDGSSKGANREQEVSYISKNMKMLAKEFDIPIIALSQLSRESEKRGGGKRPMLSDLRESGSLEQDTDLVIFIYRAAYYGILEDENQNDTKGLIEMIAAKHRNGEVCSIPIKHNETFTRFFDFDVNHYGDSPSSGISPSRSFSEPNEGDPF